MSDMNSDAQRMHTELLTATLEPMPRAHDHRPIFAYIVATCKCRQLRRELSRRHPAFRYTLHGRHADNVAQRLPSARCGLLEASNNIGEARTRESASDRV
jgi:hypothetical protein